MKKVRKGKQGSMQELEETLGDRKKNLKKNQMKMIINEIQKQIENSKKNTADSSADVFNKRSNKWQRPSFHAQKGKKGKQKSSRPGKDARQKARTKK
ncbi:unnamed protein product [Rotaria sp. Silwood1]|nr:unnamed protein product [Rotaria sp. Silwood1]